MGVIWRAGHWPIVLMDWSYQPLGVVLTALFTNGLAIVLGYAVLKSSSILLAAYLHAINNQVTAFIMVLGCKLFDPAFSFGVGIYEIATLAIIAIIVLRDPVWRGKGGNPSRLLLISRAPCPSLTTDSRSLITTVKPRSSYYFCFCRIYSTSD